MVPAAGTILDDTFNLPRYLSIAPNLMESQESGLESGVPSLPRFCPGLCTYQPHTLRDLASHLLINANPSSHLCAPDMPIMAVKFSTVNQLFTQVVKTGSNAEDNSVIPGETVQSGEANCNKMP